MMRSFLAGLFIVLVVSSGVMAQVTGFVESIGVAGKIRPDRWTPLRVNLTSQVSEPAQYQLQVWQDDLDKDKVVYTREITLSPKAQERFELYFIPQPSFGHDAQLTPGELQKGLHVKVCLPPGEGRKPDDAKVVIDSLAITFPVDNIDPARTGFDTLPGTRLVLFVTDGTSIPSFLAYQKSIGLAELIDPVIVHPNDLGENVLFYDSVDTVVWLSGNADDLDAGASRRREALEQFVRQGGKLVVCQPGDRHRIEALGGLLPVETKDAAGNWLITPVEKLHFFDSHRVATDPPIDALPALAISDPDNSARILYHPNWHSIDADGKHPIVMNRSKPKANATVAVWEDWSKTERFPYIVRGPYGLGCVTWVAQDLGDVNLTGAGSDNWPHIWDQVIGWRNDTFTPTDALNVRDVDREKAIRENGGGVIDFSRWMLKGTDYGAKGAAYVFLAVFFFVVYWFAAGPGTYLFLRHKKRKDLNWFIFGAWAFIGTALTVLLVRVLLRGDAEVRHLSVVRQSAGEPAYVYSRVGLYIPRDGYQDIALEDTAKDAISYITPLQEHPQYVEATDFPAAQIYGIPLHDDPQPVDIHMPYRSTLKKLQMRWVGDLKGGITGSAKLVGSQDAKGNDDRGVIYGILTNATGHDLKNIYFVFNYHARGSQPRDLVLFVPQWNSDKTLDLNHEYASAKYIITLVGPIQASGTVDPRDSDNSTSIKGPIAGRWEKYWTRWPGGGITGGASAADDLRGGSDFEEQVPKAFPILSLIDRIAPGRNTEPLDQNSKTRVDFLRRGGTALNMSSAVAAGRLVVLAQTATDENPIPFPLSVEGSHVGGLGRVLYQFALPVDRTEMENGAAKGE